MRTSPVRERIRSVSVDPGPRLDTRLHPRHRIDWRGAVGYQRRGGGDPTMFFDGGRIWRSARTPSGPATIVVGAVDGEIRVSAWGPGREWSIAQAPALCGMRDDVTGFDPSGHPLVRDTHHRRPDLRLGRTDLGVDALIQSIFEQKVTAVQAFSAWRRIVTWYGERAPGPTPRPMFVPPSPAEWGSIPSWAWHRAGLEPPQSRTIVTVAPRAASIERALSGADSPTRERVLTSLRGV